MTLRGRDWVVVWLGGFLLVAAAINVRQPRALAAATRLRGLREERASLEARRADLERRIRSASSRTVLVPLATTVLGLHLPPDSEVVIFAAPSSPVSRGTAGPR
jgi:hypothetical protein